MKPRDNNLLRRNALNTKELTIISNPFNRLDIQHIFLFFSLIWGIIQIIIFPPFQVPDEPAHFLRSWGIANFQFVCKDMQVKLPENVITMTNDLGADKVKQKLCFFTDVINYFPKRISATEKAIAVHFCAYNPMGYVPQALGIYSARTLDLSPLHAFYLGRFFNLLVGIFLIFHAIKSTPFGKEILFFTGLLPMTIHQLASFSCDALAISGLLFFTSQILLYSQRENLNYKSYVYLIILSLIFMQIKPGYIGFLLLFLVLPYKHFSSKKEFIVFLSLAIISNILLWVILRQSINFEAYMKTMPWNYYKEQIAFIINNPLRYVIIFLTTFKNEVVVIAKGAIGILGWLNISFPKMFYLLMIIILLILLLINDEAFPVKWFQRVIFLSTFFLTIFIIYTILYICWTKPSSACIEGFQGRYLIPAIPLFIMSFYKSKLWIINNYINTKVKRSNRIIIIAVIYTFVTIYSLYTIYSHFHDFFNK